MYVFFILSNKIIVNTIRFKSNFTAEITEALSVAQKEISYLEVLVIFSELCE
jgi:hypothetical protein